MLGVGARQRRRSVGVNGTEHVVVREEVVKAEVLDRFPDPPNRGGIASKLVLRIRDADLHALSLSAADAFPQTVAARSEGVEPPKCVLCCGRSFFLLWLEQCALQAGTHPDWRTYFDRMLALVTAQRCVLVATINTRLHGEAATPIVANDINRALIAAVCRIQTSTSSTGTPPCRRTNRRCSRRAHLRRSSAPLVYQCREVTSAHCAARCSSWRTPRGRVSGIRRVRR